jgi:hypothetical protein
MRLTRLVIIKPAQQRPNNNYYAGVNFEFFHAVHFVSRLPSLHNFSLPSRPFCDELTF